MDRRKMKIVGYLNNLGKERFVEAIEKNKRMPSFKVKFKLTRRCNLRCKKCNYWKLDGSEELCTNEVKKIIYQIAELSCQTIKFSGGEVLLRKDLAEIIRYTKTKGIKVSITSNGSFINQKKAEELVLAGVDQINISIDSHISEIHDEIVGVRGAWKKSINAFNFLEPTALRLNKKIKLVLQCVVCKENYKNLVEIIVLAKKNNIKNISFLTYNSGHLENKESDLNEKEILNFNEKIFPKIKKLAEKKSIKIINPAYFILKDFKLKEYYLTNPCYIPWINYYIDSILNIYACCASKEKRFYMGSLKEMSLKEILYSKQYDQLRESCKSPIKCSTCLNCLNEISTNRIIKNWVENGA